jgi:hypothetical protein
MVTETRKHTCEVCGRTGTDIHEYPTYNRYSGDTTAYQCDDIDSCLDRYYAQQIKAGLMKSSKQVKEVSQC